MKNEEFLLLNIQGIHYFKFKIYKIILLNVNSI